MLPMKNLFNVGLRAVKEFGKDDGGNLAGALAFAAFFSLFPLILFLVSLASFFVDPKTAQDWVLSNIKGIQAGSGDTLVKTLTDVINARQTGGTWIATIIGLVGLLFSASNVFGTLETAINRAWGCEKSGGLIRDKGMAFGMVIGLAVVLLASTILSSLLNGVQSGTAGIVGAVPWLWQIVNILISIGLLTGVLTLIYRTVPTCPVDWADVWPGALLTAILWQALMQLFGLYVGHFTNYAAVYGALGGIIALQTLILFACQILILGAEFSSEYAKERETTDAARAKAKAEEVAQQRREAAAEKSAARERRVQEITAARPVRHEPVGQATPSSTAIVVGAAAAVAAGIGLLGRIFGGSRAT